MKRVTVAICNSASFQFILPYEQKRQTFQTNSVSIRIIKYLAVSIVTTRVRMPCIGVDTAPQSFCHFFIAMSMIRYSKSAEKSAVKVYQVASVVMETTQLVLSQFKNFLT